jgi:amino acid adenylation domain-containing protein
MSRSEPQSPESIPFGPEDLGQSLLARFETVAARFPEATAVSGASSTLTYRELDQAADRVAVKLVEAEGAANAPVGLLFHHEPLMVAALLGVLKTGKAWVALERHAPEAWHRRLLTDTGVRTVVTRREHALAVPALGDDRRQVILADTAGDSPVRPVDLPGVDPSAMACILYTSGTTGEPKGVVFRHDSILHKTMLDTAAFRLTPRDRFMLLFSPNSVAGVGGIFRALLNGAGLALYDIRSRGIEALPAWLNEQKITVYHSVPTVFRRLAHLDPTRSALSGLRLYLLAGEPLFPRDLDLFRRMAGGDAELVNLFGCSEAPGFCYHALNRHTECDDDIVPVGRALKDTEIRLLDEDGREVGPGETGEIAVRSPFLALGYWQTRPGRSRIQDIRDPAGFFHTGDLGRRQRDGLLVHVGRADHLVKIAGNRIATTEVEATLRDIDGVSEAVVVDVPRPDSSKQLIGYVVPEARSAVNAASLRRALRDRLPEVMVPVEIFLRETLPVTSAGKVDRLALADAGKPAATDVETPPRNDVERRLVKMWIAMLGMESMGIHDDFFARGGDSMQAVRLITRIREGFGVDLPVRIIFESPTIAELAEFIQLLQECDSV